MEGSRVIPGSSSVHFDEISKKRIFHSIDQIKGIKRIIKESYRNLKYKLGRVPSLMDFYENGEVDPLTILANYKSYYAFLCEVEPEYKEQLTDNEMATLEYLSKTVARGKRPHEAEIVQELLANGQVNRDHIIRILDEKYEIKESKEGIEAAIKVLSGTFVTNEAEAEKYRNINMLQSINTGFYQRMSFFDKEMKNTVFAKQVFDLVELGKRRYQDTYLTKKKQDGVFALYEKYSRRDVCHLLNWGRDLSSTMYGMKRVGDDVCIFVTYHKADAAGEQEYLEGKPDYADEFINSQVFAWDSQIGKGLDSPYMKNVMEAVKKHLFVKKSDAEGTDFYYMGQFDITNVREAKKKDNKGNMKAICKVECRMRESVREDLFEYLRG